MADGDHTRARPVRVPQDLWDAYGALCERLGRNRTSDLLDHMRRMIKRHGTDEERALLARAEDELAKRRARNRWSDRAE